MEAVTELIKSSQSKNLNFFEFSRVSPGAYPLTKKPEDSGYEIGETIEQPYYVMKSNMAAPGKFKTEPMSYDQILSVLSDTECFPTICKTIL